MTLARLSGSRKAEPHQRFSAGSAQAAARVSEITYSFSSVLRGQCLGPPCTTVGSCYQFGLQPLEFKLITAGPQAADIYCHFIQYLVVVASALPAMPAPARPDLGAFDPGALPRHVGDAVWRGSELGDAVSRTVSSGFAELDRELPGGGWPTRSLTELLMPQAALCEWRLLGRALPSLIASGGRIYLIAPPKQPHAGGLEQLGLYADQVVWIH